MAITELPLLYEFGKIVNSLDSNYVLKQKHKAMPKWNKLLKQSCSLLTNPTNSLQLWGHQMIHLLLPVLLDVDSTSVNTNTPHEKGLILEEFKEVLSSTQEIVHTMLLDFRLGEDSCRVEPFTDSYTYTFAYFLIWDVLLMLCEKSSTELRYQYTDWIR